MLTSSAAIIGGDYVTVEIRILPADGQPSAGADRVYMAELDIEGWGRLPPRQILLDRKALLALSTDPKAYGLALGQSVFATSGLGADYGQALAAIAAQNRALRVRLTVDPPELQSLYWERLYHPVNATWHPLGSTGDTPFSRFIQPGGWKRADPTTERPLRLLAVIASPQGLTQYGLSPVAPEERQALHDVLDKLPDVTATYLESGTALSPTMDQLRNTLSTGYHLVHFLCHGAVKNQGNLLYLEKAEDGVDPVSADRLLGLFNGLNVKPAFCFLAVCESASQVEPGALPALAPQLILTGGVQAVVAMTDQVGQKTAGRFTKQFYERLLTHGQIDLATNEARALIQETWDWGVPVLFSRLSDNQLIDFPAGQVYSEYLSHSARAFAGAREAIAVTQLRGHGQELIDGLEDVIQELSKSYKLLARFGSDFRDAGRDPNTYALLSDPDLFRADFGRYYGSFKRHYEQQDWVHEGTSCHKISTLAWDLMPKLQGLLDQETFEQLGREMDVLGNADDDLLEYMGRYLDDLNSVVEQIWAELGQGNFDEAVRIKVAYEAQISPSLQRSKKVLRQMSAGISGVARA